MTAEVARTDVPQVIADAMDLVRADETPPENRAALYAFLYELQRRINRSLGIRQKGPTAQHQLTEYMTRQEIKELGPLYLAWEAFDVRYPCNEIGNWTDDSVQDALAEVRRNPATRDYIREIPAHLEVDVMALGEAVHAGSDAARSLYDELRAKRWRTEAGRRASLKVREVTTPKEKKAA